MGPYFAEQVHNPSAAYAKEAAEGISIARDQVASLIGADRNEVVFTNQMGQAQGGFEKGEASGSIDALSVIDATVTEWRDMIDRGHVSRPGLIRRLESMS